MITSFIMCYSKQIELSSVDHSTSRLIFFWLKLPKSTPPTLKQKTQEFTAPRERATVNRAAAARIGSRTNGEKGRVGRASNSALDPA